MAQQHTRETIRNTLKASRDWNYTNNDSKLWAIAFGLYNEAHMDQQLDLKWNCSKCYQRVKDWLEKP